MVRTKEPSITDLLNEQVKKGSLIGRLYGQGKFNEGNLFRVNLFEGVDTFYDGMAPLQGYCWSSASDKVVDGRSKGSSVFVGFNGGVIPHLKDYIHLFLGANIPRFDSRKNIFVIPTPEHSEYNSGFNTALHFHQDAIYSVEVISNRIKSFSDSVYHPKAKK